MSERCITTRIITTFHIHSCAASHDNTRRYQLTSFKDSPMYSCSVEIKQRQLHWNTSFIKGKLQTDRFLYYIPMTFRTNWLNNDPVCACGQLISSMAGMWRATNLTRTVKLLYWQWLSVTVIVMDGHRLKKSHWRMVGLRIYSPLTISLFLPSLPPSKKKTWKSVERKMENITG